MIDKQVKNFLINLKNVSEILDKFKDKNKLNYISNSFTNLKNRKICKAMNSFVKEIENMANSFVKYLL